MLSLSRLIWFVGLDRLLFDDADDRERLRKIQQTKSKARPKNPTLPIRQKREGWDTHFKTFGKGWATRRRRKGHPPETKTKSTASPKNAASLNPSMRHPVPLQSRTRPGPAVLLRSRNTTR